MAKINTSKLSEKVIDRITIYKREVEYLMKKGEKTVYSHDLSKITGISPTTVRKDFSLIGNKIGHVKFGYDLRSMKMIFDDILGVGKKMNVAFVGMGNLGHALISFTGFEKRGFNIVCGFDKEKSVIGTKIAGKPVYDIEDAEALIDAHKIDIAILAVSAKASQLVFDKLVSYGIQAFINFTPVSLDKRGNQNVFIENVDFASSLEKLSYFMAKNYNGESVLDKD